MAAPSNFSSFVASISKNDDIFVNLSYGCIFFFCCYCVVVTLHTIFTKIIPPPAAAAAASSSSSSTSNEYDDDQTKKLKYDVFLNFRGRDTRFGFTNNLKEALCDKLGIEVFLDEEGLRGGDDISPVLLQRIQESSISVVIFSKNYADSPWCLDELVQIHDQCMQANNQHAVLPVFYGVDPTHVQELQGDFGKAFMELLQAKFDLEKVKKWKDALSHISNLKGWDSHNFRSEYELIKKIVKDIESKLKHSSMPSLYDYSSSRLVGMESRVGEVLSLLHSGSRMRIVGIWGMGGIGKTTLAELVFKAISSQYEGTCFLRNVKEISPTALADELLSQLLEIPNLKVGTPRLLPYGFSQRLERRKVLIVLDDVSSSLQLEQVIGDHNEIFGPGSRVIITSRDRQVLGRRCDVIYEVMKLEDEDSLQLFKSYAFRGNGWGIVNMDPCFTGLSREVIELAHGNPLALKVLGCDMFKKDKGTWESAIRKLKDSPHKDIQNVLKLSYDGLEWHEQQILLDIACVFSGWFVHDIETILADAKYAIEHLKDMCLITVCDKEERVGMHDLIKQMCEDIVLDENRWDPRKRSRLWRYEHIVQVLNKSKGAERVEALSLDMSQGSRIIQLSPKVFEGMDNLRLLCFYNNYRVKLELPQEGLEYLPNTLRLLHWDLYYPSPSLPLNFCPENMVYLKMRGSSLTQLWEGDNVQLVNLKVCDLRESKELIKIMDFSGVPNLEELDVGGCSSLVEIPSSIQLCRKLITIIVSWCFNLRGFPSDLRLTSLEEVDLYNCPGITQLPQLPSTVKSLHLGRIGIKQVTAACIGHLTGLKELVVGEISGCMLCEIGFVNCCLEVLCFWGGPKVKSIPPTIYNLTRLVLLRCSCENLESLPNGIGRLERLKTLSLDECSKITGLPSDIGRLTSLESLDLRGCCSITSLPESICDLKSLEILYLNGCVNLKGLPDLLPPLASLKFLDLSGTSIEYLGGEAIEQLSKLESLYLRDCKRLRCIRHLPARLKMLDAPNCTSLASVSSSATATILEYCDLNFANCFMLDARSLMRRRSTATGNNVRFLIPGDEIPQWFEYKSSSIVTNISGSSSAASYSVVVPFLHHHEYHCKGGGRRRILRDLTFAHVLAPPFPEWYIDCSWHCYVLGESGVCFHRKYTEAMHTVEVEAEHVLYSRRPNFHGLNRAIWARFEKAIIPGVQVIQSGVHLNFADEGDDDDFEKLQDQEEEEGDDDEEELEDQGGGGGGGEQRMTKQYIMTQDEFEAIVNFMKQNNIEELDTNKFKALDE